MKNQQQSKNQKKPATTMRLNLDHQNKLRTLFALIGFCAYVLPYVFGFEIKLFYDFFAVGLCVAFCGVLALDSFKLKNLLDDIKLSIAIFFGCMGLTFMFDSVFDFLIETKPFVIAYILITILCFIFLLVRRLYYHLSR